MSADRILVPLPDGRWLALSRETFDEALVAGAEAMEAQAPARAAACATVEPLLDPDQAARELGVTARWLEDSARAGIIPHHKLGRWLRFRVSEVADHCHIQGAEIASATHIESVGRNLRFSRQ